MESLKQWYDDATIEPNGHLMIDLRPSTTDLLRHFSNVTSFFRRILCTKTVVLVLKVLMTKAQNY